MSKIVKIMFLFGLIVSSVSLYGKNKDEGIPQPAKSINKVSSQLAALSKKMQSANEAIGEMILKLGKIQHDRNLYLNCLSNIAIMIPFNNNNALTLLKDISVKMQIIANKKEIQDKIAGLEDEKFNSSIEFLEDLDAFSEIQQMEMDKIINKFKGKEIYIEEYLNEWQNVLDKDRNKRNIDSNKIKPN